MMTLESLLVEYLANAVWQLPLLAGAAGLLTLAARPAPLTQHRLWLAVLACGVLVPLRGMGGKEGFAYREPVRPALIERRGVNWPQPLSPPESQAALPPEPRRTPDALTRSGRHRHEFPLWIGSPRMTVTTEHWVAGLYLVSVLLAFLRMARAWHNARHLVAHSLEVTLNAQKRALLKNCAHRLRVKPPRLRASERISSPIVVGVTAPVLLLPAGFPQHDEDEVEAVFYHELAHIQRWDYLVNLICQFAAAPISWHPVTSFVRQRIGRTREIVCDAIAAQSMQSEIRYAKCLLALARGMAAGCRAEHAEALGLFGNNILEERVIHLMESKSVANVRVRAVRLMLGGAAMVAAAALAATFHIAPAMAASNAAPQQESAQPAPAAAPAPASQASAVPAPAATTPQQKAHVASAKPGGLVREWQSSNGKSFKTYTGTQRDLTPEEKKQIEKQLADAERELADATARLNSPEFKKQIEQARKQAMEAQSQLNSAEFKRQMREAEEQVARAQAQLNSSEWKRQIEAAQKQAADAAAHFNSSEFKTQMAEAERQVAEAKAQLDSPDFKLEMEDARKEAADAAESLNSPEFRRQMEDAQKQLDEARRSLEETCRDLAKSKTP